MKGQLTDEYGWWKDDWPMNMDDERTTDRWIWMMKGRLTDEYGWWKDDWPMNMDDERPPDRWIWMMKGRLTDEYGWWKAAWQMKGWQIGSYQNQARTTHSPFLTCCTPSLHYFLLLHFMLRYSNLSEILDTSLTRQCSFQSPQRPIYDCMANGHVPSNLLMQIH
jgi:hypothetical protein